MDNLYYHKNISKIKFILLITMFIIFDVVIYSQKVSDNIIDNIFIIQNITLEYILFYVPSVIMLIYIYLDIRNIYTMRFKKHQLWFLNEYFKLIKISLIFFVINYGLFFIINYLFHNNLKIIFNDLLLIIMIKRFIYINIAFLTMTLFSCVSKNKLIGSFLFYIISIIILIFEKIIFGEYPFLRLIVDERLTFFGNFMTISPLLIVAIILFLLNYRVGGNCEIVV